VGKKTIGERADTLAETGGPPKEKVLPTYVDCSWHRSDPSSGSEWRGPKRCACETKAEKAGSSKSTGKKKEHWPNSNAILAGKGEPTFASQRGEGVSGQKRKRPYLTRVKRKESRFQVGGDWSQDPSQNSHIKKNST